jgi:TRAP-type C4-dicarboxylate transport system permease small subunit
VKEKEWQVSVLRRSAQRSRGCAEPSTRPARARESNRIGRYSQINVAGLFGAVGWHGLMLLKQQIRFGEQSPIMQVGMWWATLPLVIGSALAILGAVIEGYSGSDNDPAADLDKETA